VLSDAAGQESVAVVSVVVATSAAPAGQVGPRGVHSDRRRRTTDEPEAGGVGDDPRLVVLSNVHVVNVLFLRYAMFVGLAWMNSTSVKSSWEWYWLATPNTLMASLPVPSTVTCSTSTSRNCALGVAGSTVIDAFGSE